MKTIIALISIALSCAFLSCKEKKTAIPAEAPVIVEDSVKTVAVIEIKEEKPARKENQKYFLIAGCFEYKENADRLIARLREEGYDSRLVPYYENLYLVCYDGYPTLSEARNAMDKLKIEQGKEKTWIYKSRN